MNDIAQQRLCEVIRQYTREVLNEPQRLRGLIADYCYEFPLERNLLTGALEEGIPHELLRISAGVPADAITGRMVRQLVSNRGLSNEAAEWTTRAWLAAVGHPGSAPPVPSAPPAQPAAPPAAPAATPAPADWLPGIPNELCAAAAAGSPEALKKLRKAVTAAVGIDGNQDPKLVEQHLIGKGLSPAAARSLVRGSLTRSGVPTLAFGLFLLVCFIAAWKPPTYSGYRFVPGQGMVYQNGSGSYLYGIGFVVAVGLVGRGAWRIYRACV